MKNDSAVRFVKNLFAASTNYRFGKQERDDAIALYVEKLSKWRLSADAWSKALSRIVADSNGDLPPLSTVYGILKAASADCGDVDSGKDPICLSFKLNGFDYVVSYDTGRKHPKTGQPLYAIKAIDPQKLPRLPEGATDPHLIIPFDQQAPTELVDRAKARGWFLKGWMASGASPEQWLKYFDQIGDKRPDQPRKPGVDVTDGVLINA